MAEDAVIATNDDATLCKRHAVNMGYWKDPFITLLSKQSPKKTPEISRGYFARVHGVRSLIEKFIQGNNLCCQVVSVGAGFDTLFWLLQSKNLAPEHYVEVDFPAVTRQKVIAIHARKEKLLQPMGEDITITGMKTGILSKSYSLLPADLRNTETLLSQLKLTQLDFSKPTLFIAECVLMYMKPADTNQLLQAISQNFPAATFINYDVVNMNDRFAEVMLGNLETRQCTLHVDDCRSKETQIQRFNRSGFDSCTVYDMNEVYQAIPVSERHRVEKIELLDEVHLLQELLGHYCICIAVTKGTVSLNLHDVTNYTLS